MNKRFILVTIFILTLLPTCLRGKDKNFIIAADGAPGTVIVIAPNAPTPVKFAAKELKLFLDRMTGGDFKIVTAKPETGRAVVLGDNAWSKASGLDLKQVERDGFIIKATPDTVYILGKDDNTEKSEILNNFEPVGLAYVFAAWSFERGTLYGVYDFLERLGVRWFFRGPKGTFVPTRKNVEFKTGYILENPAFEGRVFVPGEWPSEKEPSIQARWNKLNAFPEEQKLLASSNREYRLWLLRMKVSSAYLAMNHRAPYHYWERRFGKSHPEYFALHANGKRDLKGQVVTPFYGHLCYSSQGVLDETIKDADAFFSGKPIQSRIPFISEKENKYNNGWRPEASFENCFSLNPHDHFPESICNCAACKAKSIEDNSNWGVKHSRLVWDFVTQVANAVKDKHPGKYLTCLAYSTYAEVPAGMTSLPDNVIIGFCPHDLTDLYTLLYPEKYNAYFALLKRWKAVSSTPTSFWFYELYRSLNSTDGVPFYAPHFLQKLFSNLTKYGKWVFLERNRDPIMLEDPNSYIMFKLLWNPQLDVNTLIKDYTDRCYGAGGAFIHRILASVESKCVEMNQSQKGQKPSEIDVWNKYFDQATLTEYRRLADQAVAATKQPQQREAAELFSKYFVGLMEKGRRDFVQKQEKLDKMVKIEAKKAVAPVKLDGQLSDPAWSQSNTYGKFYSTSDLSPSRVGNKVKLLYDDKNLYVAYSLPYIGKPQQGDLASVYIDSNNDKKTFWVLAMFLDTGNFWSMEYKDGKYSSWKSNAQGARFFKKGMLTVEVAIPLKNIPGIQQRIAQAGPMGISVSRKFINAPTLAEKIVTISPLIQGRAGQPANFLQFKFQK